MNPPKMFCGKQNLSSVFNFIFRGKHVLWLDVLLLLMQMHHQGTQGVSFVFLQHAFESVLCVNSGPPAALVDAKIGDWRPLTRSSSVHHWSTVVAAEASQLRDESFAGESSLEAVGGSSPAGFGGSFEEAFARP